MLFKVANFISKELGSHLENNEKRLEICFKKTREILETCQS